ncbi:MAG TPA: hypothetical protein VF535_04400 [Allosphingosinicella sp.]|jgi:hypothetical protein
MDDEGRRAGDSLRSNEKLEVFSSVIGNLGTGLLAAGFGRWFLTGADGWAVIWIIFGLTAMVVAIQSMSFLDPETVDG